MAILPELAHVQFRSLNPETDPEGIYQVIMGCVQADDIDPYSTLEGIPTLAEIQSFFGSFAPENCIVARVDGVIVGYNRIIWWQEEGNLWLYLHHGRVLPEYRNRGIGTALLAWSEARIRELAAVHEGAASFGANASSSEIDSTALLNHHGYEKVFTLAQMHFDGFDRLPPSPVLDGITLRQPTAEDASAMWQSQRAAWSAGIFGTPAATPDQIKEISDGIAGGGHLWRVAVDAASGSIAGQIWCSVQEIDGVRFGVVDEINTHPDYRRRGVAQALMIDSISRLRGEGAAFVRLHTDDGDRYGAKSLYEKVGFKRIKTFPRYRKPYVKP